jgi:hypothetical protein
MQQPNKNLFFYQKTCNMCIDFRDKLYKCGLLTDFIEVEITNENKMHFYKHGLEYVPTISLYQTKEKISGIQCFEWLDFVMQSQKNKRVLQPPLISDEKNKLEFFNELEMGNSVSDLYTDVNPKNNNALPKSFLLKDALTEIVTPPMPKDNYRLDKNKSTTLIKKLDTSRKNYERECKNKYKNEIDDYLKKS